MQNPLASQLVILILYLSFVIPLESKKQLSPSSWSEVSVPLRKLIIPLRNQ